MNKFRNAVVAFMMSHPAVEHVLEGLLWAGVMGAVAYVKTTQQFEMDGLGMAVVFALKAWYGVNKGTVYALLQDQLQALMNAPAGQAPAVTLSAVPLPKGAALSPVIKAAAMVLFLLGLLSVFVSPAAAGSTYYTYSGGINFSANQLTTPTKGTYMIPLFNVSAEPVSFGSNGEVYLLNSQSLGLILVAGDGTVSADSATGGVDFAPDNFLIGVNFGGGIFSTAPDGGVNIAKGLVGISIFQPKNFGNFGLSFDQLLDQPFQPNPFDKNFSLLPMATIAINFDVLGGFPVMKLR